MAIFQGNEYVTDGQRHVVRVGATWRDFDPNSGQYGAFATRPGPNAVRNGWVPPPAPRPNPAPQLQVQQQGNLQPRQPAQPMTSKHKLGLGLVAVAAASMFALFAIERSTTAPTSAPAAKPVAVVPTPTPSPTTATRGEPRLVCLGGEFMYRDARYSGQPKCWPESKRHLLPGEWILK